MSEPKVRSVEAFPVSYQEPTDHNRFRSVCLVKIMAEDGQVGWGECCTYFPEASLAAAQLVKGLSALVVGRNPLHTNDIWRAMALLPVMLAVGTTVPGLDMTQFALLLCLTLGIMGILTPLSLIHI